MLTSTQIPAEQNDMPPDAPLLLIPAQPLSQFLQLYEIPPKPPSFNSGHEVRYLPIYCFDLCQHRRRLLQCNNLKMAVRVIQRHGLSRQLNLKSRMIKSTPNPMRPQLPSYMNALFVKTHSTECKSETDTSNRTFRIRFFAHSRVVPGRVVVNGTSKSSTGVKNIESPERLLGRVQTKYTTRRTL
jgi:hypothetical protein